jgi:hypothetical protein
MGFKHSVHSLFERWSMEENNLANIVDEVSCDFSWADPPAAACYFWPSHANWREGGHKEVLEAMPMFVCVSHGESLMGVPLIGVPLIGVHSTDVPLIDVHLTKIESLFSTFFGKHRTEQQEKNGRTARVLHDSSGAVN